MFVICGSAFFFINLYIIIITGGWGGVKEL